MKDKRLNEENQFFSQMDAKRKDLIGLKNTIDHNKEIFQAKVNKNKFMEQKNKEMLLEQKNEIIQRGENPNFFIPRKIKLDEFDRIKKYFILKKPSLFIYLISILKKRKFEEEQIHNTQEIVKKILKENQNLEKKKKLYPNLFNLNTSKPLEPIVK